MHSPLSVLHKCRRVLLRFISTRDVGARSIVSVLRANVCRVSHVRRFARGVEGVSRLRRERLRYSRVRLSRLTGGVRTRTTVLSGGRDGLYGMREIRRRGVIGISRRLIVRIASGLLRGTIQCTRGDVTLRVGGGSNFLVVSIRSSKVKFISARRGMARPFCRGGPRSSLGRFNLNVCVSHVFYRGRKKGLGVCGTERNNTRMRTLFGTRWGCFVELGSRVG